MGPGSGANRPLPPPPKTMPVQAPPVTPTEPCATCGKGKKCTEPKSSGIEYGCWCGPELAPARDAGLESSIPKDPAQWNGWVKENNLPQPLNGVDNCCMIHDLALGQVRQSDPSLTFSSADYRIAAINHNLSQCFAKQSMKPSNGLYGMAYAAGGSKVFSKLSQYNTVTAFGSGAWQSISGAASSAASGVSSAISGAFHSVFP